MVGRFSTPCGSTDGDGERGQPQENTLRGTFWKKSKPGIFNRNISSQAMYQWAMFYMLNNQR